MVDDTGSPEGGNRLARVNWVRGLRRIFWLVSAVWWVAGAALIASNAPSIPRRDQFVPACRGSWRDELTCPDPTRFSAYPNLTFPGARRRPHEVRAEEERQLNTYASCVAATELAAAARVRDCQARRDSPAGQREINAAHSQAMSEWTVELVAAAAIVAVIPFLLVLCVAMLWRLGVWVRDGFRPSA